MPKERRSPSRAGGARAGRRNQAEHQYMRTRAPEPFNSIIEAVLRDDAAYFETHPHVRFHIRPFHRGELWPTVDVRPGTVVIVEAVAPGYRRRRLYGGPPPGAEWIGQQDGAPLFQFVRPEVLQ